MNDIGGKRLGSLYGYYDLVIDQEEDGYREGEKHFNTRDSHSMHNVII